MGVSDTHSVGGSESLWQKVNGNWGIISQGQNSPVCTQVDGKGVPKDLIKQCLDHEGDGGSLRAIK